MSHKIKLYGHFDSGHVYKVMLFLELAKIDYEYEEVDIWIDKSLRPANFLARSKNAQVPCMVFDGKTYTQSNLILHHLAREFKCFAGESETRLLEALDWQFFEANRLGMSLPQLRYARLFAPQEFTQGSLDFLRSRFDQDIMTLNNHLANTKGFILDGVPSIADFSLCSYLFWAHEVEVDLPPHINKWLARISQLDAWQAPYDLMKRRTE